MQKLIAFGASTRRILLLLSFVLVAAAASLHWYGPDLDEFQPEIQSMLRDSLDLKELSFGRLSWSWVGHAWIKAENLRLTTRDEALHVKDADLAVRVALWSLLFGEVQVKAVRIIHPKIRIRIPEQWEEGAVVSPVFVGLEDAEVSWQYGRESGFFSKLDVFLDADDGELIVQLPDARLRLVLTEDKRPLLVELQWQGFDWLPKKFQPSVKGALAGEARLSRTNADNWNFEASISGRQKASLIDEQGDVLLPVKSMHVLADVFWPESEDGPQSAHFRNLSWKSGRSHLQLNGQWEDGKIQLQLKDGVLSMPIMWPWLKGLGDEEWHAWLADMHTGIASNMQGDFNVGLSALWPLPEVSILNKASFSLQATVDEAQISLIPGESRLTNVHGSVQLNQDGIRAQVSKATLPRNSGEINGDFLIQDWDQMVMDIKGDARIDFIAFKGWLEIQSLIPGMELQEAPASGRFALEWLPGDAGPRQGSAHAKMDSVWKVKLEGINVLLTGGKISWDVEKGIGIKDVNASSDGVSGKINAMAAPIEDRWRLLQLDADIQANMAALVRKYHLPIGKPGGEANASLHFDGNWSGSLSFQDASWEHWLGSEKATGDIFSVSGRGNQLENGFELTAFSSSGSVMQLSGHGEYSHSKKFLMLDKLITPAIDARVNLALGAEDAPMELTIDGKYLTRGFLPEATPSMREVTGRKMLIRLFLDQMNWGGAHLTGVQAKISSTGQGEDHLRAKSLEIGGLKAADVDALFRRPKPNMLDIRRLSARLWEQSFLISANVKQYQNGDIGWKGFTQLRGDDFSRLLTEMNWSSRFKGGSFRGLFLGQGMITEDKPWWSGMEGRLRFRVDDGRILEGGTLTRLLAAASLADLPKLLIGQRGDLIGSGMQYKRFQVEAVVSGKDAHIKKAALRSSAFDLAGHGGMDLQAATVDLMLVMRPFQNIDAVIGKVPLLRDVLGGGSHSVMRRVYHVHGPFSEAKVDSIKPAQAGLDSPGLLEALFSLPGSWFGKEKAAR